MFNLARFTRYIKDIRTQASVQLFYSTRKRNRNRFFRRERVKWKLSRDSRRYSVIRNSMNSNNQHGYRCFTWYREGYITCTIGGWVRHGWLLAEWEWESHIYIERRGNPTRHSKVHSLRVCSGVLSVPSTHDIHSSRLRARGNSRPSTFPRCTRAASGINLFVNRHGHSNQLQPWSSLYSRKYFFLTTWSFWSWRFVKCFFFSCIKEKNSFFFFFTWLV